MKTPIPIVYVAGPFRGATTWDVETNVRRAETLALVVARAGAMPLCPHMNTRFFDGQLDDTFWLEGTLELLRRCDAIVLTANWRTSAGARGEKAVAEALKLPVFYEDELHELVQWVSARCEEGSCGRGEAKAEVGG